MMRADNVRSLQSEENEQLRTGDDELRTAVQRQASFSYTESFFERLIFVHGALLSIVCVCVCVRERER